MLIVDREKCNGCNICILECPNRVIVLDEQKKAVLNDNCVRCEVCLKICPTEAISRPAEPVAEAVKCGYCPVLCEIPKNRFGACHRYQNLNGKLTRRRPLLIPEPPDWDKLKRMIVIERPLVTGWGSGHRKDTRGPAPYMVEDNIDGVDVVTCVSEAELSYSGPLYVIIDTNEYVGDLGARLMRDGFHVGNVGTELYQSQLLSIGSPLMLGDKSGFTVARTMVDIMNGRRVKLEVENGPTLEIQLGKPPVINGSASKLTGGCGSSAAVYVKIKDLVDDVIVLAIPITGLMSLHWKGGAKAGVPWSGIDVESHGKISTPGRYHLGHGRGWGRTPIMKPADIMSKIDRRYAKVGAKILVTEPSAEFAAMFQITEDGYEPIEIPLEVRKALKEISDNHESARVSAMIVAGLSGGARSIVGGRYPLKLVESIHNKTANVTIGGAPTYLIPGDGINIIFDPEKSLVKEFTRVPTPSIVLPVEFTMTKETFDYVGGYTEHLKPLSDVKKTVEERD